jgi:tetratricopeptide (TPR) repeat protein
MANSSRLDVLLKFYEEDPNDPFNAYALALEYAKTQQDKALTIFYTLTENHPSYLPTYYHAAKLAEEMNLREEAIRLYNKGIQVAQEQNNQKALKELKSALDELEFDL